MLYQEYLGTSSLENQAYTSGMCPNCGYCDKCGRQNFQPYPSGPYWPAPYYPYIWYNVPQTGYVTTTTFPETGTYVWVGNVTVDTIPSVQS